MNNSTKILFAFASIGLFPLLASAHVTVAPTTVTAGEEQTFTVSVPNAKSVAIIGLRLVAPAGLSEVTPHVKSGWKISTKEDATGNVTEIDWTRGIIPAGYADEFKFSAQMPATASTLEWRAYQLYADGSERLDKPADVPSTFTNIVLATGPGSVGQSAGELAIFALSVASLVVAGIALSRRRTL